MAEAEGWPAGVRLAGLRLAHSGGGDAVGPVGGPIAHERAIADYVWSHWLADSRDEDVEFLTLASILPWMSGPVCDHVLERCDSAQSCGGSTTTDSLSFRSVDIVIRIGSTGCCRTC